MTAPARTFAAFADLHPQHAATLVGLIVAPAPASIVRVKSAPRGARFYTGVDAGAIAVVLEAWNGGATLTVRLAEGTPGAAVVLHDPDVEIVFLHEWTHEHAIAAQKAALARKEEHVERALRHDDDARALAALRVAREADHLAFVLGVFARHLRGY